MSEPVLGAPASPSGSQASPEAAVASSPSVSIPSATVVEYPGEHVTWFKVLSGWEWASIFVRPLDEGAEVVAHSSFGTFGYTWIAMGGDWREFLRSCSREYAMRKLAGQAYEVPLDREEFISTMREELDGHEKGILDAWGILDTDQERRLRDCRDALDEDFGWEDIPQQALFWYFNGQASGAPYALELYETRLTKLNPQVAGFWETIWGPFATHLASAMSARSGETEGLAPKAASAVPKAGAQNTSEAS